MQLTLSRKTNRPIEEYLLFQIQNNLRNLCNLRIFLCLV